MEVERIYPTYMHYYQSYPFQVIFRILPVNWNPVLDVIYPPTHTFFWLISKSSQRSPLNVALRHLPRPSKNEGLYRSLLVENLPCFHTGKGDLWKNVLVKDVLKQNFEGQIFPILSNRSRVWPVNHLYHHHEKFVQGRRMSYILRCTSCASNNGRTKYFRNTGNRWDPHGGSKPWSGLNQAERRHPTVYSQCHPKQSTDLRVTSYI